MSDHWAPYERAWAQDPHHLHRSVCLSALIAEADRAVAAALVNLSREYDATILCGSHHTPAEQHVTSAEDEGEYHQRCVDSPDSNASLDWRQLYCSLCLIQAPMVRCSRPAFRQVCRAWGARVSYTHMLIAESFVKSPHARHAEFARYEGEDRLVVQLAAKSGPAAAQAAVLLRPYCDGIDLNCGCPQRWAMKEGIGSALLDQPERVADMVRSIRNAMPDGSTASTIVGNGCEYGSCTSTVPPFLPCVVKMRIKDDLRRSVDFARQCEAAGVSWLTVHGRTPTCHPSAAVQFEAVKLIRENLSVPVVLNGGVTDVSTAMEAALRTGCGGLMSANGLLDNPAMFYCGASRAAAEAEMSFARAAGDGHPEPAIPPAPGVFSEVFSPVQPVSFLWAPDRSNAEAGLLRYTVPDMWQAAQVLRMARLYVSPAERSHIALLRSNLSVLNALQEIGATSSSFSGGGATGMGAGLSQQPTPSSKLTSAHPSSSAPTDAWKSSMRNEVLCGKPLRQSSPETSAAVPRENLYNIGRCAADTRDERHRRTSQPSERLQLHRHRYTRSILRHQAPEAAGRRGRTAAELHRCRRDGDEESGDDSDDYESAEPSLRYDIVTLAMSATSTPPRHSRKVTAAILLCTTVTTTATNMARVTAPGVDPGAGRPRLSSRSPTHSPPRDSGSGYTISAGPPLSAAVTAPSAPPPPEEEGDVITLDAAPQHCALDEQHLLKSSKRGGDQRRAKSPSMGTNGRDEDVLTQPHNRSEASGGSHGAVVVRRLPPRQRWPSEAYQDDPQQR
ncbi:Dihydrouridine synthase (Dus) family protein [Leishmania donovani]|uniref:Dihydrouridine synthase (Dus) family protein n=1 Tax=Leishmania donovani TaxID=5661 RepID=A0A504XS62_LEIDO|nr:Dihydrouridine synthase (Dus) family protein [Leishmania donovani]